MPNYFDTVLDEILFGKRFPRGTTEKVKENGEWVERDIPPEYLGPNARKKSRMEASMMEDAMLREQLGYKRSKRRGEKPGTYSLADYPGLRGDVWRAESGLAPRGQVYGFYRMNQEQQTDFLERQRQWAEQQKKLLGW